MTSQIQPFASIEPSVTTLPITCGDDGDWYGWGHIDRRVFIDAVHAVEVSWQNMGQEDRDLITEDEVGYVWALPDPNDDERWRWVGENTPGAVPITTLDLV